MPACKIAAKVGGRVPCGHLPVPAANHRVKGERDARPPICSREGSVKEKPVDDEVTSGQPHPSSYAVRMALDGSWLLWVEALAGVA